MAKFILRFSKKVSVDDWNTIEKALSHKYLKKIATGNPKRPWYYIYNETFLKPFTALKDLFGLSEKRISTDYEQNNIKKDYGVDKKTFAAHVLEFFTNKDKWNTLFKNKADRDKNKKPVTQKKVEQAFKERASKNGEKVKEPKRIINRSLMRKVWEIYSPEAKQILQAEKDAPKVAERESEIEAHENRSNAMLGNDNAKKNGGIENGADNSNEIEQGRISERDTGVRNGGRTDSGGNGSQNGDSESNGSGFELDSNQFGERLGGTESSDGIGESGAVGTGKRLTKGEILKIREEVKKLLATKKDEDFTESDKALLRQYEGAGGTGEEGASNSGVLYEYYTPQNVINKVWQLVDKYNPRQDKTVIEPSSGIGRFAEGRKEPFTMFELEEESARINRILHPDATIKQGAFQENFMNGGMFAGKNFEKFDVAVGNPPYGRYSGRYKGKGEGKEHSRYEEYFIDRTLDTLKDGGILAMVVPSSFLRSGNTKIKEKLEGKGQLLEAWRLPNGTFGTTGVGTDIIVMRKGKGEPGSLSSDKYFESHPDCIIGTETERTGRFGNTEKYVSIDGMTIEEALDKIKVDSIPVDKSDIPTVKAEITEKPEWVGKTMTVNFKTGRVTQTDKDGNVKVLSEGKKSAAEEHKNRSDAMKGNKNAEGKHEITYTGKLISAEEFSNTYGVGATKEEMEVWKHTDYNGEIDMTKLSEDDKKYIENSGRYIKKSNGNYENVVTYASGNIQEKLETLEEDYRDDKENPDYLKAKTILEGALPAKKNIGDFTLSPIDHWVKEYDTGDEKEYSFRGETVKGLIADFFRWARDPENEYRYGKSPISKYEIPEDIHWSDVQDYILGKKLNVSGQRNMDEFVKKNLNMRRKNLRKITAEKLFNRFLKEGLDKELQDKLASDYNRQYNATVNPDYSKMPVFVDGMCDHKGSKKFKLLKQQVKGISFLASKGSGLLAYDVGVGKTATGIVSTVNQLQTGKAKRPLICVPSAVYENWIQSIHELFPGQEVVGLSNLRGKALEEAKKGLKDGVLYVCTYEALKKIGFKPETEDELYEDVEFATDNPFKKESKRDKAQDNEDKDFTVGQMTKTEGDSVNLEDLGIDHITVDEIHNFNHVFSTPRMIYGSKEEEDANKGGANEFQGMGGSISAQAQKMFAITQYIQRHNNNRNVFGLSATPFTNKPAEVYSILSLIARKRLQELGIYNLHHFLEKFADVQLDYVVDSHNNVKQENVMKSYNNLDALQALIEEYIDKVDGEEAGVIRPQRVTKTPYLQQNDLQKVIIGCELDRMANASKDDKGGVLVAMNNMRQAILSPSFVAPENIGRYQEWAEKKGIKFDVEQLKPENCVENSPKLKFVCDSIIEQWKRNKTVGQVMYVPRGVENFKYIKEYLVKHGYPEDAIGFMGKETGSPDKRLKERETLKNDFNNVDGKCKLIIGTESIKEGVSLNGNASTIYNCMLGWNPTEATQVEGRIWRQGNKQGVTDIVYPLMYDTLDARLYELYEQKKGRIDAIFSYKGNKLNVDDVDANEMKFSLIKDPKVRAGMEIDRRAEELKTEMRINDTQRDILHDNSNIFDPIEENDEYKFIERNIKAETEEVDKETVQVRVGKDAIKTLKNKKATPEQKAKAAEEWLKVSERGGFGWGVNTDEDKAKNIENLLKWTESNLADTKVKLSKNKKSLAKIKYQRQKQIEGFEQQGIHNKEQIEERIQQLTQRKMEMSNEYDHLKDHREELEKKYTELNEKEKQNIPSHEEQVKAMVDSIMSTARPMDEVKQWIIEGREAGKTNAEIKDDIDRKIGLKKSISFAKDSKGNLRLYIRKSTLLKAEM